MKEIVNNFLLPSDKFMPEMHLKQLGFTYSACGPVTKSLKQPGFTYRACRPFTKNKERIQKFK